MVRFPFWVVITTILFIGWGDAAAARIGSVADSNSAHWSYDGAEGPDHWNENYEQCEHGHEQSPLNINAELIEKGIIADSPGSILSIVRPKDSPALFNFFDNGHTLQAMPTHNTSYSGLIYDNSSFQLMQMHFHTPSEHRVDNLFYPMELHLVHRRVNDSQILVLGIFFDIDNQGNSENSFIKPFINQIPAVDSTEKSGDQNVTVNATISLRFENLLSEANQFSRGFWVYEGSLTTPPCTEHIKWTVAKDSMKLSVSQWNMFRNAMGFNSRPTQPRSTDSSAPQVSIWLLSLAISAIVTVFFN